MTCWRCGRVEHSDWCSDGTPNDCTHCGGNPCRWWCLGADRLSNRLSPVTVGPYLRPGHRMEPVS